MVLSPTVAHEPPPIGYLGPTVDPRTHLVRVLRYVSMAPLQNVTGAPAISLPLGQSPTGLPLGVRAAAGWGRERTPAGTCAGVGAGASFRRPPTEPVGARG